MQKCFNTEPLKINGLHIFPNSKVVVNIFSFINCTVLLHDILKYCSLLRSNLQKQKSTKKITNKNTTLSKKLSDPEMPWQHWNPLSIFAALCSIIADVTSYFVLCVKSYFVAFDLIRLPCFKSPSLGLQAG